mgnify:CR=1 FL=1
MQFNTVLRKLRKDRGLTQKQLALALGLSESAISMYERGQREPDFETLEIIADYFNVDMDFLTGRTPYSSRIVSLNAAQAGSGEAAGLNAERRAFVDRVKAWDDATFHRVVAVIDAVLGEKQ